jgi:hypothetical protein
MAGSVGFTLDHHTVIVAVMTVDHKGEELLRC